MTTESEACGNDLLYEVQNGIGILTLNRPHRRNATTFAMYNKIKQICARAGTNDDPDMLKVIIFKGAGDAAFAAGTDISQFKSFSDGDDAIDYEYKTIMRNAIILMMEDPRTISVTLDTVWVAKAIERIGDHAKNIAEYVIYIVEGKDIRHTDYAALQRNSSTEKEIT